MPNPCNGGPSRTHGCMAALRALFLRPLKAPAFLTSVVATAASAPKTLLHSLFLSSACSARALARAPLDMARTGAFMAFTIAPALDAGRGC